MTSEVKALIHEARMILAAAASHGINNQENVEVLITRLTDALDSETRRTAKEKRYLTGVIQSAYNALHLRTRDEALNILHGALNRRKTAGEYGGAVPPTAEERAQAKNLIMSRTPSGRIKTCDEIRIEVEGMVATSREILSKIHRESYPSYLRDREDLGLQEEP